MKKLRKVGIMLSIFAILLSLCACEQNAEDSDEWVGWQLLYKGAINNARYYFVDDSLLLNYVDFRSGACVSLCSKAGCTHGKDCDAKIMWDNLGAMMDPVTGAQLSTDQIVSMCNELIEAHTAAGYALSVR